MKKLLSACFLFLLLITSFAQQQVWKYPGGGYQIREIATTNNKIFYQLYSDDPAQILAVTTGNQNSALILHNFDEATDFTVFGNNVVFIGRIGYSIDLWISDGTIAGTLALSQFLHGDIESICVFNNRVYFTNGTEIWYTDGTLSGTKQLLTVPHSNPNSTADILSLTALNNKLIYYYYGQLGVSDGISSTIEFLSDNTSKIVTGARPFFQTLNNKLYFLCSTSELGTELWSTDGTEVNTELFIDIHAGSADGFTPVYYEPEPWFSVSNQKMYFVADDGGGNNVWVTDGTISGTSELYIGANGVSPVSLKSIDGNIYFSNNYSYGFFFSDGTNNTVQNIGGIQNPRDAYSFTQYNDSVYFVAYDADHGYELWKTGNTAATTTRVTDICAGDCSAFNHFTGLIVCDNILFFSASDVDNDNVIYEDYQLWKLTSGYNEEDPGTTTTAIRSNTPSTKAYPNPCEDFIAIEIPAEPSNVTIISATGIAGKALWKYENDQVIVNTQSYVSGMYKVVIDGYEPVSVIKK